MPRDTDLRNYALMGAQHRLLQISEETQAIYRTFPELRGGRGKGRKTAAGAGQTSMDGSSWTPDGGAPRRGRPRNADGRVRRRRPLSAAGRKRISDAQKARWARQRGETAAAATPSGRKKK